MSTFVRLSDWDERTLLRELNTGSTTNSLLHLFPPVRAEIPFLSQTKKIPNPRLFHFFFLLRPSSPPGLHLRKQRLTFLTPARKLYRIV